MRIRGIRLSPIDDVHCVAHVAWIATHARDDLARTVVDFEAHYLVLGLDGEAKALGWISGDEEVLTPDFVSNYWYGQWGQVKPNLIRL